MAEGRHEEALPHARKAKEIAPSARGVQETLDEALANTNGGT